MKKILFFLAALVGMTLAGCTDDEFVGNVSPPVVEEEMSPILFTSSQKAFTRAEDFKGAEAASKLGNKFVVFGYKGGQTKWKTDYTGDNAIKNNTKVFDNYLVEYAENTANTTESNSNNWEYVGKGVIKHATDHDITKQTIKYWDYSKDQYDFFAWSTGSKTAIYEGTASTGNVLVSAMNATAATDSDDPKTGLKEAYTFTGSAVDLAECYISDLVTVYKGAPTGSAPFYNVVANGYQQPVTLKFRQLGTKVRIGIYETVPGYSVKDVQFYSASAVDLVKSTDTNPETSAVYGVDGAATANASAKIFTTVANGIYKEGTYTVYFPTVDQPTVADNNQAHIDFAPKTGAAQKTTVDWGGLNYTFRESGESSKEAIYLGRTSNTASYAGDSDDNYYVIYLPNQKGTNLNLRVNYTLESIDGSKETINVKGATAQVPLIYTQWKPGYAYTYLFKISDKTNGHTGNYNPLYPDDITVNSDPAGLYPITFDAVVVNAEEDATQETITTISTPSITTYQKGSKVVNQNEYDHATGPIFVTVNDGVSSYELVSGLNSTSSVAGYFTKTTINEYGQASGVAQNGVTYFTDANGTEADPQPTVGTDLGNNYYIITSSKDIYTSASGTAQDGTDYYRMVTTAESGKLVTLIENNNALSVDYQANLFTLPNDDKVYTEADVVDALQLQDDNATSGTIKGRSGLVLTPADFTLETSIEYGVDGNAISLTGLPNPDGSTGTYDANAMKFEAANAGTYAFVYTKTASTGTTPYYQAKTFTTGDVVKGYYRYKLVAATTPVNNSHTGDVEKGVTYFNTSDASSDAITAFLGQNVDNLFVKTGTSGTNADYTPAKGYAQTGTKYYYTTNNGLSYQEATSVSYADFTATSGNPATLTNTYYYYDENTTPDPSWVERTEATPVDGRAYYTTNTGDGTGYCVIYPQRTYDGTTQLYVIDKTEANMVKLTEDTDKAVKGMTYFDRYEKNSGVYYTKIIKVL